MHTRLCSQVAPAHQETRRQQECRGVKVWMAPCRTLTQADKAAVGVQGHRGSESVHGKYNYSVIKQMLEEMTERNSLVVKGLFEGDVQAEG